VACPNKVVGITQVPAVNFGAILVEANVLGTSGTSQTFQIFPGSGGSSAFGAQVITTGLYE
jgi:hypothetical protein